MIPIIPQELEDIILDYKEQLELEEKECVYCEEIFFKNDEDIPSDLDDICDQCYGENYCELCKNHNEDCGCIYCSECDELSEFSFYCNHCNNEYCSCRSKNDDFFRLTVEGTRLGKIDFCENCFGRCINIVKRNNEYKLRYENREYELENNYFVNINDYSKYSLYNIQQYADNNGLNPKVYEWTTIIDI